LSRTDLDNVMPHDLDVERLILGYVMVNGTLDFQTKAEDFYSEGHRLIFQVMSDLNAAGKIPDMPTVVAGLASSGDLDRAGGIAYVTSLTDGVPTMKAAPLQYLDILRRKAALRRLIQVTNEAMMRSFGNEKFEDVAGDLLASVDNLQAELNPQTGPQGIGDLVVDAYQEVEAIATAQQRGEVSGVPLGFKELDRLVPAGLKSDELMVIGGRPGQGKTSLILNLLANMAKKGKAVCFFSIEMGAIRLVMKLLAIESGVPLLNMATGFVSREDWSKLAEAAGRIGQWKVWIDDSTGLQVSDLRSRIRQLKVKLDVIMVDYIQILSVPKHLQRATDNEKIAHISTQLKFLNKSLGVPIVAAAQLSRASDKRKGGKPQLSDLRQSGQIEQDADIVALIHREEDEGESVTGGGTATILLAKHRNGPTGELTLAWDGKTSSFGNLWRGDEPY